MAIRTAYANGQFCWVDLMARDTSAAKSFYGELFGWETAAQDTQGGHPYTIFMLDGRQVAGMGGMNDEMKSSGMPPVWNSYISVDDISAVTNRAKEAGGDVIMEPFQIMESGQMAIITDPSGAAVSLWQKIEHFGAQLVNDPDSWVWNELITSDVDAVTKFYRDLFGWTAEPEESAETPYWIFHLDDRPVGGMLQKTPEMGEMPSCWTAYFAVDDIQAKTDQLVALGGKVLQPPFEVSVGHISVVSDTQDAMFELIQLTVPVDG